MNTKLIPFSREQVDLMRQTLTRVMPLEIAPALSNNGPISGFFLANPPHVKKGQSLELTWSVRNATKATLSGPNLPPRPVALEGTFTLAPTNDGTYVLVVEGPGSTLTMSALAVVEQVTPPPQPDPGEDGVVYDLSSTVEIDTVLIGSDPGSHGLHVDHSHPGRFFGDVTITAVKDGFWSDPTVWNLNRIPIAGDVVRIPTKLMPTDAVTKTGVINGKVKAF